MRVLAEKINGRLLCAGIVLCLLAVGTAAAQEETIVKKPQMRMVRSNGINMRIAEMGKGPLVILIHGWPESWYSCTGTFIATGRSHPN